MSNISYNPNDVPDQIGYYLAGFTDGEGSFNFSFRPRNDYKTGWKVSACFNVSNKDKVILDVFKKYLKCGTLRARSDGIWYYEVNTMSHLIVHVVPFFKQFPFLSGKKQNDFVIFCKILKILANNNYGSKESIRLILDLRNQMNHGGKRKFSDAYILAKLKT